MKIAKGDDFESGYMNKFRALASPFGLFLEHEKDRAALDIGIHFTQGRPDGSKIVTPHIAWFQLKGKMASTLSAAEIAKRTEVSVSIEVRHLQFWAFFQYPVFLVVYLEALDEFIWLDVKTWIAENYGSKIITLDQETVSVPINIGRRLSDGSFTGIRASLAVPQVARALNSSEQDAYFFVRDDQLIKSISTAEARHAEIRMRIIKYGSKTRTEVYFEERAGETDEWQPLHSHWEFMMPCPTVAFPYLSFTAFDEDNYVGIFDDKGGIEREDSSKWDDDEWRLDFDEVLVLDDGRIFSGEGWFEMMEYILRPTLNPVGQEWAEVLQVPEKAELLAVDDEPTFVSII